jgi:integrase
VLDDPELARWLQWAARGGKVPFTAANKILKVNSFSRTVLHLDPGHGVIVKKDYKRELRTSKVPTRYTKQELDALFGHMKPYEHLLFSTFLDSGLRKRERMFLEDSDLIMDELRPGVFKCELRVQSKPEWGFQTKTGQTRNVLISKETMDRLQVRKAAARPSKLLFPARTGNPDHHMLDRLKDTARRAGLDADTVNLHKFRATAATTWLRSKELGGKGWDISFVRSQLGHRDLASIEHYIQLIKSDEVALVG